MGRISKGNPGKRRKKDEWKTVEASRKGKDRVMPTSRGLSNIPQVGDVGSADYRRLVATQHGGVA